MLGKPSRLAAAGVQPRLCRITATAKFKKGTKDFGLMFRTAKISTTAITSESSHRTIGWCSTCGREINPMSRKWFELERPLDLSGSDTVNMTVLIDGNKGVALYQRYRCDELQSYDLPDGNWGFFATDGLVTFSNIEISTPSEVG